MSDTFLALPEPLGPVIAKTLETSVECDVQCLSTYVLVDFV